MANTLQSWILSFMKAFDRLKLTNEHDGSVYTFYFTNNGSGKLEIEDVNGNTTKSDFNIISESQLKIDEQIHIIDTIRLNAPDTLLSLDKDKIRLKP